MRLPSLPARLPQRGLYAISDGPRPDLLRACAAALRGGASLLQYRDKTTDPHRRREEALALAELCRAYDVPLIINDDVELASEIGAGVHLGAADADLHTARRRLGTTAILGASCYDSLERAREAAAAGADYLAFGAFFPSPTKPQARRATLELLRAARALARPLVAIGGITVENAPAVIEAGADLVAVISGVFGAADVEAAARRYARLFTSEPRGTLLG
jgi:thiamine-phosphate pyrophosphorylase